MGIGEAETHSLEERLPLMDGAALAESAPKCPESKVPLSISSFVDGITLFKVVSGFTSGGGTCGD